MGNLRMGAIQTNWNTSIEMEHRIAFMGYKYNTQHAFRYAPFFRIALFCPFVRFFLFSLSLYHPLFSRECMCVSLLFLNSFLVWNIRLEQVVCVSIYPCSTPHYLPATILALTLTLCANFPFVIHSALCVPHFCCAKNISIPAATTPQLSQLFPLIDKKAGRHA